MQNVKHNSLIIKVLYVYIFKLVNLLLYASMSYKIAIFSVHSFNYLTN